MSLQGFMSSKSFDYDSSPPIFTDASKRGFVAGHLTSYGGSSCPARSTISPPHWRQRAITESAVLFCVTADGHSRLWVTLRMWALAADETEGLNNWVSRNQAECGKLVGSQRLLPTIITATVSFSVLKILTGSQSLYSDGSIWVN